MPHDGRFREHATKSHQVIVALSSANGSKLGPEAAGASAASSAASAAELPRGFRASHLVSRQYAVYWLLWLLVCGCFAIRHTTKLLDAAGQQHFLLAPPALDHDTAATAAAAAYLKQQTLAQHAAGSSSSSSSSSGTDASSSGSSGSNNSSSSIHISAKAARILAEQHTKWPDGYVAICAVIKDQWPDLRYWIEYHRWLGVSKFYIYDNNSTLPAMLMLWDYMQAGVVDYEYFLGRPRRRPDFADTNQYRAYQGCLLQHFKQHRWIAFIDADEFLVFPQHNSSSSGTGRSSDTSQSTEGGSPETHDQAVLDPHKQPPADFGHGHHTDHVDVVNQHGSVLTQEAVSASHVVSHTSAASSTAAISNSNGGSDNLGVFLSQYEHQAAIGVNWVLFGSSGHLTRPAAGPLASFTACVPRTHWESTHVKVIANTNGILGVGGTPHEVLPRPGRAIVDVDQLPFKGPKTPEAKWHKLVLHHYVLKSKAEFVAKKTRGSGAGNKKDWGYWEYVEKLANETCTDGLPVSQAFMRSNPNLALPRSAHMLQGCHKKASEAYEALMLPQNGKSDQEGAGAGSTTEDLLPC